MFGFVVQFCGLAPKPRRLPLASQVRVRVRGVPLAISPKVLRRPAAS